MQGLKAEHEFAKQFNATLIHDLDLQYKDIDAEVYNKRKEAFSVSIKHQAIAEKTRNFSFEFELEDTRTSDTRAGNFEVCEAFYYAIKAMNKWFIFKTSDVDEYIEKHKKTLRVVKTSAWLEEDNRRKGRKYDRAWSYLVPVCELEKLAVKIVPCKA